MSGVPATPVLDNTGKLFQMVAPAAMTRTNFIGWDGNQAGWTFTFAYDPPETPDPTKTPSVVCVLPTFPNQGGLGTGNAPTGVLSATYGGVPCLATLDAEYSNATANNNFSVVVVVCSIDLTDVLSGNEFVITLTPFSSRDISVRGAWCGMVNYTDPNQIFQFTRQDIDNTSQPNWNITVPPQPATAGDFVISTTLYNNWLPNTAHMISTIHPTAASTADAMVDDVSYFDPATPVFPIHGWGSFGIAYRQALGNESTSVIWTQSPGDTVDSGAHDQSLCDTFVLKGLGNVDASDQDFSSVTLLLHFENTLDDASLAGNVLHEGGSGETLSSTVSKFGIGSLDCSGLSDYVYLLNAPGGPVDAVGGLNNPMTFEWFAKSRAINVSGGGSTTGAQQVMVAASAVTNVSPPPPFNDNAGWRVYTNWNTSGGNELGVSAQFFGSVTPGVPGWAGYLPLSDWVHYAVVADETGAWNLFVNGVSVMVDIAPETASLDSPEQIWLGSDPFTSIQDTGFPGWIDEVRMTKGVARYRQNFTPPQRAFLSAPPSPPGSAIAVFGKFVFSNAFPPIVGANLGQAKPRIWIPKDNNVVRSKPS